MRTSRKKVEDILNVISTSDKRYRLVWTEILSEHSSSFKYWIVEDVPTYTTIDFKTGNIVTKNYQTGWRYSRTILQPVSLKKAYKYAVELLEESISQM